MNSYKKTISVLSILLISNVFLTACESFHNFHLGPKLGIKIPIEEALPFEDGVLLSETEQQEDVLKQGQELTPKPVFSQLDNDANLKPGAETMPSKMYIGSGRFTSRKSSKVSVQPSGDGKYSINFDAADIGEISKIILSDSLHENYILSPKVKGSVTLQTTKPLHKEELLPTLEMLLRMNGAVLVKREGIYRIEPASQGLHTANTSMMTSNKLATGYQIKVIPLEFVGATDMAEIIKPIAQKNAILKVDAARNILFVAGTKDELERILDLVDTFDVNYIAGMSFGLYPLENTEVGSAIADIENIFNKGEKSPLSGMLRFIAIKHLNAILVVSPQKAYMKEAEKWIRRLDQQNGVIGEGGVIVYRVQYVDAVELAATLGEVISGIIPTKSKSISLAPGQKIAKMSNKSNKSGKVANVTTSYGQGNTSLEGVNIIADEPNNALIIMAEPQQYRMLSKIIKHLDVMPLQVLIDATIVAVKLDDDLSYGVRWKFANSGPDGMEGIGVLGTAATGFVAAATGGFSYGLGHSTDDIRLVFDALAKDDKINVLSSPSLMVLNNQEAIIKVGDSVPIRTTESTNTSGGATDAIQTSSIEMLDTGVILKVKPRVNASGMVVLEIDQSVDSASRTTASNIDSPTILKRQIQTTVTVVDGESVVLGGLINEQHTFTNTGIPFLKDIPYVGWLFGSVGKKVIKDELIVVITPRVVANKFDARKVTDEFKRKLTGIYYDEDIFRPDSSQTLRGYDGLELQTEEQRETSLIDERL